VHLDLTNTLCRVASCTDDERSWLREYLSYEDVRRAFRQNRKTRRVKRVKPPKVSMFDVLDETFPAGLLPLVRIRAEDAGHRVVVSDRRPAAPEINREADVAWLRDYQLDALRAAVRRERGVLWMPTGSGKTEILVGLTRVLPTVHWLFVVHRKGLMYQAAARFVSRLKGTDLDVPDDAAWRLGAPLVGVVGDGLAVAGTRLTVATFQSLRSKIGTPVGVELVRRTGGLVVDECFPAGTMVGSRPIETIRPGDVVVSYDAETSRLCCRRVADVFSRRPSGLVRLWLSNGDTVVCTPGHPFLTDSHGYVPAQALCGYNVRRWESGAHDRRRDRRTDPRFTGTSGGRCQEDGVLRVVRVDRVEVLEPGRDGTYGGVCPDGLVYNLSVPGPETYLVGASGLVVHNCHTLPADTFYSVSMALANARYRIGLSGTPLDRDDRRSLMAIGALGPVVHRIPTQTLVDAGVLARPNVQMVVVEQDVSRPTYRGVYGEAIVRSRKRNRRIVDVAVAAAKPSIVYVREIAHGKALTAALERAGLRVALVWGSTAERQRAGSKQLLARGDIDVVVASVVWQEGIDIPSLASIVVACGGKSTIAALQRAGRGMRPGPDGSTTFELWDIDDRGNGILERHSSARRRAYEREGFDVVDVDFGQLGLEGTE